MISVEPIAVPAIAACRQVRIADLAARYRRDEKAFDTCRHFHPLVRQGQGDGCSLIVSSQDEIALFSRRQPNLLEYRMTALASAGDMLVLNRRSRDYEQYLSSFLGLGGVDFVEEPGVNMEPLAVRCRNDEALQSRIGRQARKSGGLTVHAYLTTGNVWRLAQVLAERSGVPVAVCGPTSRISRRVNDKLWFADCVRQLFGPEAVPPSFAVYGPAGAIGHIQRLSRISPRVVVKIPQSAGSIGNIAFESEHVAQMDSARLRNELLDLLFSRGWQHNFPFLVGVWNCAVVSSPSVQLWLPDPEQGPPVVEGIFEQNVAGPHGTFVGASRAQLSSALHNTLLEEALEIGGLFQQLGYFGRCSLDAIIAANDAGGRRVQWIECNGRWGGVSLPLTMVHRLVSSTNAAGLVVVQHTGTQTNLQSFPQIVAKLDDLLFRRDGPSRGIVLTCPPEAGPLPRLNFVAVANNQTDATALAEEAIRRFTARP
jgi:hypothetical protein